MSQVGDPRHLLGLAPGADYWTTISQSKWSICLADFSAAALQRVSSSGELLESEFQQPFRS